MWQKAQSTILMGVNNNLPLLCYQIVSIWDFWGGEWERHPQGHCDWKVYSLGCPEHIEHRGRFNSTWFKPLVCCLLTIDSDCVQARRDKHVYRCLSRPQPSRWIVQNYDRRHAKCAPNQSMGEIWFHGWSWPVRSSTSQCLPIPILSRFKMREASAISYCAQWKVCHAMHSTIMSNKQWVRCKFRSRFGVMMTAQNLQKEYSIKIKHTQDLSLRWPWHAIVAPQVSLIFRFARPHLTRKLIFVLDRQYYLKIVQTINEAVWEVSQYRTISVKCLSYCQLLYINASHPLIRERFNVPIFMRTKCSTARLHNRTDIDSVIWISRRSRCLLFKKNVIH